MTRAFVDLTGPWQFLPDPASEGLPLGYFRAEHDDASWPTVSLPGAMDDGLPGLSGFEGPAWFRRRVIVTEDWLGRDVRVRFEGVNHRATVYVNGELVGSHADGYLPFEFPVHDQLRFGQENLIAVLVDGLRRPDEVPGMQRGWRHFAGILRECSLTVRNLIHLADVHVLAEPQGPNGSLKLQITASDPTPDCSVGVEVLSPEGKTLATFEHAVSPTGDATIPATIENVTAWSPDTPVLYQARVTLRRGQDTLDTRTIPFGFRRIETRGEQVLLNGKPIFLCGFNRHEDSPRTGMCPDVDLVRQDLLAIKAMGCNFVRLCHYPHHPLELALCDQIGLLVMAEVPLYWWHGRADGQDVAANKFAAAERQIEKLIRRDRNHPCVAFWSVSNETYDFHPDVAEGNAKLVRYAKSLDPSRLAVHVLNFWHEDPRPRFAADDVLCVNAYPSLSLRSKVGSEPYDYRWSTEAWRKDL
ncbi:MAG: beta galactosidase jelly roll domain-containing protein, partial [Phycisphaeraceae bacterium]|nr:beta galactosidase jelly roll domain-containing protein [Phycisphaeraceae bacterium]